MLAELFDEEAQREEYMLARDKQKIAEGKAQGIAQGIAQGKAQGMIETLVSLVKDGLISIAEAAKRANLSVSEFEAVVGLNHD